MTDTIKAPACTLNDNPAEDARPYVGFESQDTLDDFHRMFKEGLARKVKIGWLDARGRHTESRIEFKGLDYD